MDAHEEQLSALREALGRAQAELDEAQIEVYALRRENAALRAYVTDIVLERTDSVDLGSDPAR